MILWATCLAWTRIKISWITKPIIPIICYWGPGRFWKVYLQFWSEKDDELHWADCHKTWDFRNVQTTQSIPSMCNPPPPPSTPPPPPNSQSVEVLEWFILGDTSGGGVVIITTDDDKDWQSRDCGGKTSTRREQLLFCDNLSIEQAGLARPGLPGWHPATLNCLSKKIIRIVLIRARSPGQSGQSDHHGPVTVTVESAGVSRY